MLWYLLLFPCAAILWMFLADALGAVREQSLAETDYRRNRDVDPVAAIPAAKKRKHVLPSRVRHRRGEYE